MLTSTSMKQLLEMIPQKLMIPSETDDFIITKYCLECAWMDVDRSNTMERYTK